MKNIEHSDRLNLSVDTLEPRMMLSTVTVTAAGEIGEEIMQVIISDQLVLETTVSQESQEYVVTTPATVSPGQLKIRFANDLYQPEQGIDRNLIVQNVSIDEVSFDPGAADVFSTGTWLPADGVSPGFGRGNVLHTNGYLQFSEELVESVFFDGAEWQASRPLNQSQISVDSDGLTMSGRDGGFFISREVDFQPNSLLEFNVEAVREVLAGSFNSSSQPWATVGVDFYDSNGREVWKQTIEVNSAFASPGSERSVQFNIGNATSAYMWIWVGQNPQGVDIPLEISNISLSVVDQSDDVTPPTAILPTFAEFTSEADELYFLVTFEDDTRLPDGGAYISQNGILVEGSGVDYTEFAVSLGPGDVSSTTQKDVIYGLFKPDGSSWTEADNGFYEVTLQDNALVDSAGNVAPGRFLGLLRVNITPTPPDTVAPEATLGPVPTVTQPTDEIQFVIYTTDNVSPFPFANDIRVVDESGEELSVRAIAGGFDTPNNRNWELYVLRGDWTAANNGIYTVLLPEGGLEDDAGNVAPAKTLGTIEIAIELAL